MSKQSVSVSAMLPAHQRIEKTLNTIRRLKACSPQPAEILVHVAKSQTEMLEALENANLNIRIVVSKDNLGPGGARNKMLQEARYELVVSLDDDSYPIDSSFFSELPDWFDRLPEASILALNIDEPSNPAPKVGLEPRKVASFVGCGCAYRRSHFLESGGYVPIPIAYGMEEVDLALRYAVRNRHIYYVPVLRIFHDTALSHHATAEVAAMQVANTALLAFLRYPLARWPLGSFQVVNKWLDTLRRKRFSGASLAFPLLFSQIWRYRAYRATVPTVVLDAFRRRRQEDHNDYNKEMKVK